MTKAKGGRSAKLKGDRWERELVQFLQDSGFIAQRACMSNGANIGEHPHVDVLAQHQGNKYRIQCKSSKVPIRAELCPSEHVDFVAYRADRQEPLCIIPLSVLTDLIAEASR